jgi:hypothetical protein
MSTRPIVLWEKILYLFVAFLYKNKKVKMWKRREEGER